jgi:hypothetical protein
MEERMDARNGNDVRTDVMTAKSVEEGLKRCRRDGVHPALLFMEQAGVPRSVALRVLCSPEYFRKQDCGS